MTTPNTDANGWNFNLDEAPRGATFKRYRVLKDSVQEIEDFAPDYVWVATKCDKVIKSYFVPPSAKIAGRWSGLAIGEQPIAWQPYTIPKHPYLTKTEGEGE